ncbi:MAG TPA: SDR family NAD(P)-dependent oxidoreductase [Pseudonocardiaceae bacterium]|nr:SDR family NAD(P)-dependent oxidoreductase [Pseudonocardiaceae bacterium]
MIEQRVALVTGANKGIGLAIARGLLEQGVVVYLGARDTERDERAAEALAGVGPSARFVQLDVTDPASITAAATRIDRDEGVLDALVNNAGIVVRPVHPPSRTSIEDMRERTRPMYSASSP